MAEEEKSFDATQKQKRPLNILLLVAVVNSVLILAVTGILVYTRMIYKRPPITETGERKRIEKTFAQPTLPPATGLFTIEPFTVNIQSNPTQPRTAEGQPQQIHGKLHYATVGLAIELRDTRTQDLLEQVKPQLMDQILLLIGRKKFQELTTVQGRYILRSELLEMANRLLKEDPPTPLPAVTRIFFTHFLVQ